MVTTSRALTASVKTKAPFPSNELKLLLEKHLAAKLQHQLNSRPPKTHGIKLAVPRRQPRKRSTLRNLSIFVGILSVIIMVNSMLPCGSSPFPRVNVYCTQNQSSTFDFTMLNSMLNTQEQIFANALTGESTDARLPLVIKNGEEAMRELWTAVSYSNLRSKSLIVEEISTIVDCAREISEELQRFSSDTGYTATKTIYFTKETHRQLSNLAISIPSLDSPLEMLVYSCKTALAAMGMSGDIKIIRARYMEMSIILQDDISQLRERVVSVKATIRLMETALRSVQDLASRDGVDVKGDLRKVMGTLWYRIAGGYGDKIEYLREQKNLIDDTFEQSSRAGRHIDGILLRLNKMDQDMVNLRQAIGTVQRARIDPFEIKMHLQVVEKMTEGLEGTLKRSRAIAKAELKAMMRKGFREIES